MQDGVIWSRNLTFQEWKDSVKWERQYKFTTEVNILDSQDTKTSKLTTSSPRILEPSQKQPSSYSLIESDNTFDKSLKSKFLKVWVKYREIKWWN